MPSADCILCRRVALSTSGSNTQMMGTADARGPAHTARSTTASHSTNARHIGGLLDSRGARLTRHSRDARKERTNSKAYDPTDIAVSCYGWRRENVVQQKRALSTAIFYSDAETQSTHRTIRPPISRRTLEAASETLSSAHS